MAMTYAALAKSLGITLKSSSSSTSSAGSLPVSTPPPASTLETDSQTELPEEPKSPPLVEVKIEESPVSPVLVEPSAPAEEVEIIESSTAKADELGVEADAATDIASSRSSSPGFVAQPSSALETPQDSVEDAKELTNGSSHSPAESAIASADGDASAPPTPMSPQRSGNFPDMTAEQLHHAKVLVLDLLGWGVPPEYLLQRGVSCALLRTIFTDLRLRLPDDILADRPDLITAQT